MRWPRSEREQTPLARARLVPARDQPGQVGAIVRGTISAGALNSGSLLEQSPAPSASTANSGISPTIERTLSGIILPSGRVSTS